MIDVGIHLIWLFAHFLVFSGLFVILHQALVTSHLMDPILHDWFLRMVGAIVAPLSLFLVSVSVYFEKRGRTPPSRLTLRFSAPFMMGLALLFGIGLLLSGGLSTQYVDGLSAIALGGAMMRLTGVPLKF